MRSASSSAMGGSSRAAAEHQQFVANLKRLKRAEALPSLVVEHMFHPVLSALPRASRACLRRRSDHPKRPARVAFGLLAMIRLLRLTAMEFAVAFAAELPAG